MKLYQYLVKQHESQNYFVTQTLYSNDQTFLETYNSAPYYYQKLKHTEVEINEFLESDVEEVVYNQHYAKIPEVKLKYQYEWRYQKSMLWFITPEKFESDDDFKNYISKAVVLDLIDFRRFVKPSHKEIGI